MSVDYTPNEKLHEVKNELNTRVDVLVSVYERTPRWRWIVRRDLRTTINCVGIVADAISASAHTYKLGG